MNYTTITKFKRLALASIAALLLPMSASAKAAPEQHLNVLFLVADDLNTWLLDNPDRYGGKVIAPNIRRLAESGVTFKRSYTASPSCSPSRTSIFSGIAPWKSGLWENGIDIDSSELITSVPHLSKYFRDHGYYTSRSGKIVHGYDQKGAWDDYQNGTNRTASPQAAPLNGWARKSNGEPTETDWGVTDLEEKDMKDSLTADYAIAQLQKDHDKPFFIACGMFHPHMPWYVPQEYLDLYPLDDIVIPEFKRDDLDDVPELGRKLSKVGTVESILEHNQHREAVQGYLASSTFADAQIGRVLDALDRSPYKDNTLVVLLSDHGFHLGEKMHWQKRTLWEEATHNVLMFRVPGVSQAGTESSQLVSLLDLYPTLVELCGLPTPDHLDGRSIAGLIKNPSAQERTHVLSAHDGHIAVRTDRYRYIRYKDGSTELYDLSEDPHQWTNQATNPEFQKIRSQMDTLLPAPDEIPASLPWKKKGQP